MSKSDLLDAWREAVKRYPDSEPGLTFFWVASGLAAINIDVHLSKIPLTEKQRERIEKLRPFSGR